MFDNSHLLIYHQGSAKLFEESLYFLCDQFRKSGRNSKPVVLHSLVVGGHVLAYSGEADWASAAILHDVIEDTDATANDIEVIFGTAIARTVLAVSYDKHILGAADRNIDMFTRIRQHGQSAAVVKAFDLYSNSFYIREVPEPDRRDFLLKQTGVFLEICSELLNDDLKNLLRQRIEYERVCCEAL